MAATGTNADPVHDVLRNSRPPLDAIFRPRSVAVIGASERPGSVGRTILWNLISNPFGGTVFPVNSRQPSVLGIKAYPTIAAVPDRVELAVIATPAATVPDVLGQCVDAQVRGAIVISAGFKELGPPGVELERQALEQVRRGAMRLIGPNCLGVMNPYGGLNATFAAGMARPGSVGFISQSGALGTAILDWSFRELVGFSAFASVGSMLDVGWGDLIDYLGSDPRTQSIVLYMESIGDARSFLSAAREVALSKPIIVIKAGRTEAAAKAAASHTGALAGSDEVLNAAFRRCGVLRVHHLDDLFSIAEVLGKQPRPKGPRLTILTNAGGPGVLATDALIDEGGELAPLAPVTTDALNHVLPPHWSRGNPIDILGDADAERYAKSLEIAAKDPNSDGLLVILTPQDMTDPTKTAELLKPYAKVPGKPVLASWMGGPTVRAGEDILNQAGIPTFGYPDLAARAFTLMWRYSYNLRGLYETPSLGSAAAHEEHAGSPAAEVAPVFARARAEGRTLLDEYESKAVLAAYGIPTVPTRRAASEDDAATVAAETGFPVVLKLWSRTITHKTDVGGVRLNLADEPAVRAAYRAIAEAVSARAGPGHFQGVTVQPMVAAAGDAYEVILGSTLDAQFGPVILFGSGGQLVEVYKDRALALPPLNGTLARRVMEQTKIYTALHGVRGRHPVDLAGLEQLLVRFARLVVEQPWVKECDINPLVVSPTRVLALDARFVLHDPSLPESGLPRPVIRPYPARYVRTVKLKDGSEVLLRPIRPEDEPLVVAFHHLLSERTVRQRYFRFFSLDHRVAHERMVRICFNDYDREIALVAERPGDDGRPQLVGFGRLGKILTGGGSAVATAGGLDAEFALLIADAWQNRGLGRHLLESLIRVARDERVTRLKADILADNLDMQRLCEKLGFRLLVDGNEPTVLAEYQVTDPGHLAAGPDSGKNR